MRVNGVNLCTFCGRSQHYVDVLISADSPTEGIEGAKVKHVTVFICNGCIKLSEELVQQFYRERRRRKTMTEQKQVINVDLFGGKSPFQGREVPLRAVETSCSKFNSCTLYEDGVCAGLSGWRDGSCKHAHNRRIQGYTSRAKKYHSFKSQWSSHEKYEALSDAKRGLGVIDGEVWFCYSFINIEEVDDSGEYRVGRKVSAMGRTSYIPIDKFDVELIKKVCSAKPQAMMGGTIEKYGRDIVPKFLRELSEVMPELHLWFIHKYPEYNLEIDHTGRKALLTTLSPGWVKDTSESYPNLDSEWYWDGEHLHYEKGYVSNLSFIREGEYEVKSFMIKPKEDAVVRVTDNNTVNANTKFKD